MATALLAFFATFALVGIKAIQQINVATRRYKGMMLCSMILAVTEVAVVSSIVLAGWSVALPIGLGGGLGAMAATYFNHHYLEKTA